MKVELTKNADLKSVLRQMVKEEVTRQLGGTVRITKITATPKTPSIDKLKVGMVVRFKTSGNAGRPFTGKVASLTKSGKVYVTNAKGEEICITDRRRVWAV